MNIGSKDIFDEHFGHFCHMYAKGSQKKVPQTPQNVSMYFHRHPKKMQKMCNNVGKCDPQFITLPLPYTYTYRDGYLAITGKVAKCTKCTKNAKCTKMMGVY